MTSLIISLLSSSVASFCLGWVFGRRKFSKDTAVMVIENLKATIKIYEITHKEQMEHLYKKYNELKEEIRLLKVKYETKN